MSRKGNCWDNACKEHFFGTLKAESGYDDLLKSSLLSYEETKKLIGYLGAVSPGTNLTRKLSP